MCCDCNCWVQFKNSSWTIVLIIVILWSYYTYVVEICVFVVKPVWKMTVYLIIYHMLFILFVSIYFIVMFYRQWYIPRHYFLNSEYLRKMQQVDSNSERYNVLLEFCKKRNIRVYMRTFDGGIRWCEDCGIVKPDRTHHCSSCDMCILKMDHHCPWVNNCIGFFNYKYFVVFLLYATIYCYFVAGTGMEYCVYFILDPPTQAFRVMNIMCCVIAALVIGTLTFVMFFLHMQMIGDNETTIESMYPPTFSSPIAVSFSKGCRSNYDDQCGGNCCLWCLPINTYRGNGYEFDVVDI